MIIRNFQKRCGNMSFHSIEEALADLKRGRPVIVLDDEDRENEGDFVALAEKTTPELINFMITYGKGLVCTPLTGELASRLKLPLMTDENTDPYATAFTVSIDYKTTSTGVSAYERATTIQALVDEKVNSDDFNRPGHIFPLVAKDGGVLARPGHTEAAVDLARLCGAKPVGVICEIINDDGTMARYPQLKELAHKFSLKMITIEELIHYRKRHEFQINRVVETTLPTDLGNFNIIGYSSSYDEEEHIAIVKGDVVGGEDVLVRIHSECMTGDVFHSQRCDCGQQLKESLKRIEEVGRGIVLYMRQEGRGIGLLNKLRAYALQDEGLDTVEANEALGFKDDEREYHLCAQILNDLQVSSIQLMTNNPRKIEGLKSNGINVSRRVSLEIEPHEHNEKYLRTKRVKLGHLQML